MAGIASIDFRKGVLSMQFKTLHDRSYITLDLIDRQIIDTLNKNARASYTEIGNEIGLSRVAVQMRINALMENKVIEQFSVAVNPDLAGIYLSAFFDISIEPKYLNAVATELTTHPFITHLFQLSGPCRLHMHGQFIDQREMEDYIKTKLYVLPGIVNVDFQIVINMYKNRMGIRPLS